MGDPAEIAKGLRGRQRQAFWALARIDPKTDMLPTCAELGRMCQLRLRTALHGALARLEEEGLVERAGVASSGARTWRLTEQGQGVAAALNAQGEGE